MISGTPEQMKTALNTLRDGGVVVFPTETAYGLAADATNQKAVERVYAIKRRDPSKTIPLLVASIEMAQQYMEFTPELHALVRVYWPGALTIVGRAKEGTDLAPGAIRDDGTIAMRISSHPVAGALCTQLDRPMTATSANIAGKSLCYSREQLDQQFATTGLSADYIFDVGVLIPRKPSTIVREVEGGLEVLRQGELRLPNVLLA